MQVYESFEMYQEAVDAQQQAVILDQSLVGEAGDQELKMKAKQFSKPDKRQVLGISPDMEYDSNEYKQVLDSLVSKYQPEKFSDPIDKKFAEYKLTQIKSADSMMKSAQKLSENVKLSISGKTKQATAQKPESAKQQKLPKKPEIKEITRDTAESAFSMIKDKSTTLDKFAKKIKISTSEIPTDPQHRSCYFCVLSFFVQQKQVKKEKFDGKFCENVLESFLSSKIVKQKASSARLITLIMRDEVKVIFSGKAKKIVEGCKELIQENALSLILRIMELIGQSDKDYAVYEKFVQNCQFAK